LGSELFLNGTQKPLFAFSREVALDAYAYIEIFTADLCGLEGLANLD